MTRCRSGCDRYATVRVHVISDMEGVSGIVKPEQTSGGEPMYEEGRKLYTEEINAAVRGAKAAGATEIVVMDCHGAGGGWTFNSLVPDLLAPRLRVGRAGGVDGLHRGSSSRAATRRSSSACTRWPGTQLGNMNHTVSGRDYQRLWFNGTEVGETGINAALCGTWGCPVLLVTGDEASCDEGKALLGDGLTTVAVKQGLGAGAARQIPPVRARELIEAGAQEGARRPEGGAAVRPRQPVRDQGRVQAHPARRPAPLPPRRRAARRAHDPRRGGPTWWEAWKLFFFET